MTTPDYDTDFYAWTQAQAAAIRAGQWEALDIEHVAEEIEDLWKPDRHNLDMLLLGLVEFTYGVCRDDMACTIGNRPLSIITGGCWPTA
jgi:Domain of unknown function DUF29